MNQRLVGSSSSARRLVGTHPARWNDVSTSGWLTTPAFTVRRRCAQSSTDASRRFFVWTPYLNRELGDAIDERAERALIEAGAIQATGFRYVGERP